MGIKQITRLRVLEIVNGYDQLKSLQGIKLTYAITKTMKVLKAEAEAIEASKYTSDTIEKYSKEYQEIVESEAKRDADGNFIMAGTNQVSIENIKSFQGKTKVLNETYAEELAIVKVADVKYEKFLKEKVDIEFFCIVEENLPENITVSQMEILSDMIDMD